MPFKVNLEVQTTSYSYVKRYCVDHYGKTSTFKLEVCISLEEPSEDITVHTNHTPT